ncbi:MAG: hypothetical protein HY434_02230 [Candidatus Liptonbacteria bacterium]|nr:hypothetical protein [Candidatus Liptonbacteria bacterium]
MVAHMLAALPLTTSGPALAVARMVLLPLPPGFTLSHTHLRCFTTWNYSTGKVDASISLKNLRNKNVQLSVQVLSPNALNARYKQYPQQQKTGSRLIFQDPTSLKMRRKYFLQYRQTPQYCQTN